MPAVKKIEKKFDLEPKTGQKSLKCCVATIKWRVAAIATAHNMVTKPVAVNDWRVATTDRRVATIAAAHAAIARPVATIKWRVAAIAKPVAAIATAHKMIATQAAKIKKTLSVLKNRRGG